MRTYDKSIEAYKEAVQLMPGGVNSPVPRFQIGRHESDIYGKRKRVEKSMILTATSTLIMSCPGGR